MSHILTVLSLELEHSIFPSGDHPAIPSSAVSECPSSVTTNLLFTVSQIFSVVSSLRSEKKESRQ